MQYDLNVLFCIFLTCLYRLVSSLVYIYSFCLFQDASTRMNQSCVPHNNLSFHRGIHPSYHNFIKWRPSTQELCDYEPNPWHHWMPQGFSYTIMPRRPGVYPQRLRTAHLKNLGVRNHGLDCVSCCEVKLLGSSGWCMKPNMVSEPEVSSSSLGRSIF